VNATDLCDEVGSNCTYVAKYNSSHSFETFTRGAATNAGLGFNASTTNEDAVYFIYVSSNTTFENRTWNISKSTLNFTLRNASTGWNIVPILNRSGVYFWELDYSLNGNYSIGNSSGTNIPADKGYNSSTTNITTQMSFYNESAASGSKFIPFRSNWTWYNTTFIDYGDAVWVHYNTSTAATYDWANN